jgi:hypothetical protein
MGQLDSIVQTEIKTPELVKYVRLKLIPTTSYSPNLLEKKIKNKIKRVLDGDGQRKTKISPSQSSGLEINDFIRI